jgi:iron complex transport system permease protein
MSAGRPVIVRRMILLSASLLAVLLAAIYLGMSIGSTGVDLGAVGRSLTGGLADDQTLGTIIWKIRFPRALLAALIGATLSLGGLVFQAILRNPLAEPYILGISGGAAIGAITGILLGLSRFPGVSLTSFAGSMSTLLVLMIIAGTRSMVQNNRLLLSGVMVNAFCGAVIMFLISVTQDSRLHNIIFWMMGDLSLADMHQVAILSITVAPCFVLIFYLAHAMNVLLLGQEMAQRMGFDIRIIVAVLLVVTSLMVSATVSHCGLVGFVGLVIPHLFRLLLGADHRLLVPACLLGGGAYMVLCDILARTLPSHGEMPAGVVTALIGAPIFIYLLKRADR